MPPGDGDDTAVEVVEVVDPAEVFDITLPESWLNPSTGISTNHEENNIPLRMSVEQLEIILEGMSHYPADPNNTLVPLMAFRAGFLPPSLFNFVYRLCRQRKSDTLQSACKRVMYIINMAYGNVSFMERNGFDWRKSDGTKGKK